MELVKRGKTKDVFKLSSGDYLLKFKNTVTGNPDGSRDPGGNSVVGEVEGVAEGALRVTAYYFELLKKKNIPTHYVSANIKERELTVRPAKVFGSGLEFVCRYKAEGSFIRRFGEYCARGQVFNPPILEVTLKDDGRDDPPANKDIIVALGLMTAEQFDECFKQTRLVCDAVKDDLAARGLELIDIKLEFGIVDGRVCLIDEISAGNMRVFRDGVKLDYVELSALIG